MNYLYLLLLVEFLIFGCTYFLSNRDILSPANTMCIMFILSTLFAVFNITSWNIVFEISSFAILATGILVFCISSLVFMKIFSNNPLANESISDRKVVIVQPQTGLIVFFIVFNVIICAWYYLNIKRFVGGSGLSFGELVSSYRRIRVNSLANGSSEDAAGGVLNQLLKVVKASGHVAAFFLINSSLFGKRLSLRRIIGLIIIIILSFVPSIFVASRGEFIKFLSFILMLYYISWQQKYNWRKVLSGRILCLGLLCVLLGIPLFYYSAELIGRSNQYNVFDYVSTYIGGPVQLFNLYVKDPIPTNSFGEESLVGITKILNVLGIGEFSGSTNLESRQIGIYRSNVYTFFRRPLHDFGLLGMFIFTILVALLFAYIYYGKIKNRSISHKTNKWVLVYSYLYYWLVLSSIDQYSQSYISVGASLIILLIVLEYDLFTQIHFSLIE